MLYLYSLRWSIGFGWVNQLERECSIDTAKEWLAIFADDERDIDFFLTHKKIRRKTGIAQ
jgi:hypothetical protein